MRNKGLKEYIGQNVHRLQSQEVLLYRDTLGKFHGNGLNKPNGVICSSLGKKTPKPKPPKLIYILNIIL